ncbi:hypothetical protein CJU90_3425 [Yarrowia sp. C11]|nr:hypothetical protein CKK34_4872 [Yarrowia sp. E02]KAG5369886.1 hypothetical protein CJU90_3425 [Yarrowia sp. C11]
MAGTKVVQYLSNNEFGQSYAARRTNTLLATLAPAFVAFGIHKQLAPQLHLTSICRAFFPRLATGPGVSLADEVCQISAIHTHYTTFEISVALATLVQIYTAYKLLASSDAKGRVWGIQTCAVLATASVAVALFTYALSVPYPVYLVSVALQCEKAVLALGAMYACDMTNDEEKNTSRLSDMAEKPHTPSTGFFASWPDLRLLPLIQLLILRMVCKDWLGSTVGRIMEESGNPLLAMLLSLALAGTFYMWSKHLPEFRALTKPPYLHTPKEYRDSKDTLYSPNSSTADLTEEAVPSPLKNLMIVVALVSMTSAATLKIMPVFSSYMWDWRALDLAKIFVGMSVSAMGGLLGTPTLLPYIFLGISKLCRRSIKPTDTNVVRLGALFAVAAGISCTVPNDVAFIVGVMVLSLVRSVSYPHMLDYIINGLGPVCGSGYALALVIGAMEVGTVTGDLIVPSLYASVFPATQAFFAILAVALAAAAVVLYRLPAHVTVWGAKEEQHGDTSSETDTMSPEIHSDDEMSRSISPWPVQ